MNAISPGHIDTPIFEGWGQGDALTKMKEDLAQSVPLGRMGDPDDIAKAVSFLASDALQGRGTPSPGLEVAGEYIASQFRRAGLEPAGGDGYFQNAPYHLVTPNTDGFQFTLSSGGKDIRVEADAVAVVLFEEGPAPAELNFAAAWIEELRGSGEFAGKPGDLAVLHHPQTLKAKRLIRPIRKDVKLLLHYERVPSLLGLKAVLPSRFQQVFRLRGSSERLVS